MRVIAGKARRLPLKTVRGMETRPTTDRTKETLFNILQPYLADGRFLDLFSGSGAIGIEALSRGAAVSVFIENNPRAAACIRENLDFTGLIQGARVYQRDVLYGLKCLEQEEPFTVIFMDPPYGQGLEREVLTYLADSSLVSKDTLLVVEASLQTDFGYLDELGFRIQKRKEYKTNAHILIVRK